MLEVACAILKANDKFLICQRSEIMKLPLKWEFPGGKIESGETKEDCLRREIEEELGVKIIVGPELKAVSHMYPTFSIFYPFICQIESGEIKLSEHAQYLWVNKHQLLNFDWAEADLPIVHEILRI